MKILFTTDLHGSKWKYKRLFEVAKLYNAKVVINGGDMLPKDGNLLYKRKHVTNYLENHLSQFESAGIYYLCYFGNDDLKIFDKLFEEVCEKFAFVFPLAQRKVEIGGYEFVGMNWVVDYPFRLKDRCRKDTHDYVFQEQYGTGLLSTPEGYDEIENWFSYANTLPTIEDELSRLPTPSNMSNSVYVIHMPPYKLGLDKCGHGVGSRIKGNL